MGRTPKSASEKAKTGASRRPARIASPASTAPVNTLKPPGWMTRRDAKTVWYRVVPELQRLNIMNESFRDVIGRYCVHFADFIKFSKDIDRKGAVMMVKMTNSDAEMPRQNPAIRIRDTIEKSLIDIEDRFGISPLARYRIISHQAANPQRDLFGVSPAPAAPAADKSAMPPPAKTSPVGLLRTIN